MKDCLWRLCK